MSTSLPDTSAENFSPTKITYVGGRPTTITLRRCKLVVVQDGEAKQHVFDRDVINVGAMDDNDVVVDDETVSRNHCKIFREGNHYILQDLNSTNGTFINRVRIREAFLRPNCTIRVGKTDVHFAPVDEQVEIVPSDKDRFGDMIGKNAKLREIYAILEKIAPTDATVVIEGETGTGKEVVARTVHQQSPRREGPFIVFDCGAVPENLIESELFGHEKGSFTGAVSTRQGVFELANGGTVFLDELGELASDLQPKLLRVLEQREVKRVGGSRPIKVDVRVVAATNRDLEEEVRAGRFREDLFYRLSVVRISLPPLRDRLEDIEALVHHFLDTCHFNRNADGTHKVTAFSPETLECLHGYAWPGNIRELLNIVERAVSFSESDSLEVQDLPDHVAKPERRIKSQIRSTTAGSDDDDQQLIDSADLAALSGNFKEAKEQWVSAFEKDFIAQLLKQNDNNISHAAREAGIDRKYFRKLMKKYEITVDDA
ncbi:MAG: sigma 54-interacting transcriptional regulator [Myxococcales bacterium]|nr:MAG: sigma 54-interacting transcriptional regulator [Myxococcales bacterium]